MLNKLAESVSEEVILIDENLEMVSSIITAPQTVPNLLSNLFV
jgi:hypothetical protein